METKIAVARVLILEPQRIWRRLIKRQLEGFPVLIQFSGSVEGARKAIKGRKIDLLVVSGCASRHDYSVGRDVLAFVGEVKGEYPRLKIVATSSDYHHRDDLKKAGCDYDCCK